MPQSVCFIFLLYVISVHFLSAVLTTSDRIYRAVVWNRNHNSKTKSRNTRPTASAFIWPILPPYGATYYGKDNVERPNHLKAVIRCISLSVCLSVSLSLSLSLTRAHTLVHIIHVHTYNEYSYTRMNART